MGIFSGQTILVTGASGGIGEAIARTLGEQGAMVCLTGRDRPRLRKLAGRIPDQKARCYPADLTIGKEVESVEKKSSLTTSN